MKRLSFAFFTQAAITGFAGMVWGSHMGSSGDHSTLTAHAHLNLLGWVGMAVMGGFHALADGRVPRVLGWVNFILSSLGAVLLPLAMVLMMSEGGRRFVPLIIAGSMSAILGMLAFLACILVAWRRTERAASPY